MRPEQLRQLVLEERDIAFDVASRAMACASLEVMRGHTSKVRERLEQCSPETRVYLGWLWERYLTGERRCVSAVSVQASLREHCIHHWLWEAVEGLSEEAQAVVIPELLEHYREALEEQSLALPPLGRYLEALGNMGDPDQVNTALRRVHLTEWERSILERRSCQRERVLSWIAFFLVPMGLFLLTRADVGLVVVIGYCILMCCFAALVRSTRGQNELNPTALWLRFVEGGICGLLSFPFYLFLASEVAPPVAPLLAVTFFIVVFGCSGVFDAVWTHKLYRKLRRLGAGGS